MDQDIFICCLHLSVRETEQLQEEIFESKGNKPFRFMHLVSVQTTTPLQCMRFLKHQTVLSPSSESYPMVQDAFASCVGGVLSVVVQELRLTLRSASHGVEIKSIPSGRHASEISSQGQAAVNIGDLYADEEKQFLINLSVPIFPNPEIGQDKCERKTSLLDITCSYKDIVSKKTVQVDGDLVEIRRPLSVSPLDIHVNLEVDRQRNRLRAAEGIAKAQQMVEAGNLTDARDLLFKRRTEIIGSTSYAAGDTFSRCLGDEMDEMKHRMDNRSVYQQSGRAFALSGMSSHSNQRATTRANNVPGGRLLFAGTNAGLQSAQLSFGAWAGGSSGRPICFGCGSSSSFSAGPVQASNGGSNGFGRASGVGRDSLAFACGSSGPGFGASYATPNMSKMVAKSQQVNKTGESTAPMEEGS